MRGLHSGPRPLSLKEPFLSACAHNVVGEARALLGRGAEVQSTAVLRDQRLSSSQDMGIVKGCFRNRWIGVWGSF